MSTAISVLIFCIIFSPVGRAVVCERKELERYASNRSIEYFDASTSCFVRTDENGKAVDTFRAPFLSYVYIASTGRIYLNLWFSSRLAGYGAREIIASGRLCEGIRPGCCIQVKHDKRLQLVAAYSWSQIFDVLAHFKTPTVTWK